MFESTDKTLLEYELVDWSKKRPIERLVRKTKLTKDEAITLNRALAMNRTTLRYVKVD